MDDDLSQLEAELKRLRPAAPTRDFLARIEREIAQPATAPAAPPIRRTAPLWWLWAGALPAAAALAVMITLGLKERARPAALTAATPSAASFAEIPRPSNHQPTALEAAFKPVSAENVLYAAQDEGLVTLDDGTTARRERLKYIDTITWKNPRTNASVRWTLPREEVRVVPVKFQ